MPRLCAPARIFLIETSIYEYIQLGHDLFADRSGGGKAYMPIIARVVEGDLLDQSTEVIVNAWNRNIIPWWLLLPQGVSGAIKRRAGYRPFVELGRAGAIPLGQAVTTGAGKLPYEAIIHVAGINMLWRATRFSIRQSVISAMGVVNERSFRSVAFPIIGGGTGGFSQSAALALMLEVFAELDSAAEVVIVRYTKC
jgi:O-acetyl-ADP-ribose deacetylase (regulator of RNase III)